MTLLHTSPIRYTRNYNQYVGHLIRGFHEIKSKNDVYENLPVGEVIEVSDWKMKFIMLLFRETMPDFFGKSGNPWVGTMFVVRTKPGPDLTCFYYDGFMDDKKEDAFAASSFLQVVQGHFFMVKYPNLFPDRDPSDAIFYSVFLDGAGCYVAVENLLTRIAFSSRINVYMKAMFIPEAYYNKTPLDGHFAVAGKQMRAAVSSGGSDAYDATSMFKARIKELTKGEGAKNFVVHFEPNRDQQCVTKSTALPNIKKMSARMPVWIDNTRTNRILVMREEQLADCQRKTCAELKEILTTRQQPTTGLKATLVQRVIDTSPDCVDVVTDEDPPLKYLLFGLRLHRHSGMGTGVHYTRSEILSMWKDKPQVTTGVNVVEPPTAAGGCSQSERMGGNKKVTHGKSRLGARVSRGTMNEMKAKRLATEHNRLAEENAKIKRRSKGFWCRKHDKCNRWFATRAGLLAHHRNNECQSGIQMFRKCSKQVDVNRILNRTDHIKRVVSSLAGGVTTSSRNAVVATHHYDGVRLGLPGGPYVIPASVQGYAAKIYRNCVNLSSEQRAFLEWCFQLGEKDKNLKMGPRKTAKLMHIHGTTAGCSAFSASRFNDARPEYWEDKGVPTFRVSACLDHWYVKSWFSTRKTKGDPDALESVRYGGDLIYKMLIVRLREVADRLNIKCLTTEGEKIKKSDLRKIIATRLSSEVSEHFVGNRVKCLINGEESLGTVLKVAENADNASCSVKLDNDTHTNVLLEDIVLIDENENN
jgi:hypothetical protein